MATGGLGIRFKLNKEGNLHVKDLIKDGPALQSGRIHRHDVLARIDDLDVLGWDLGRVKPLIVGPQGTPVVLGLLRAGSDTPIFVRLERTALPEPATESSGPSGSTLILGSGSGSEVVVAVVSALDLTSQIKILRAGVDEVPIQYKSTFASESQRSVTFLQGACRLSGPIAVARHVSRGSKLLGTTAVEDAVIAQWCSFAGELQWLRMPGDDPRWTQGLGLLNARLRAKTFLVGERLTLADLFVQAAIAPAVQERAPGGLAALPNVLRWFDHVQHLPAVQAARGAPLTLEVGSGGRLPFHPLAGSSGQD